MAPSSRPCRVFLALQILLAVAAGASVETIQVISSTCKKLNPVGGNTTLTCPNPEDGEMPDPADIGQDDLRFCCGTIATRYCCTLENKLAESPDFDPRTETESDVQYRVFEDGLWSLGPWGWVLLVALIVLFGGLALYLTGCLLSEILRLVSYVLCCRCFRKKTVNGWVFHPNNRAVPIVEQAVLIDVTAPMSSAGNGNRYRYSPGGSMENPSYKTF